MKKDIISSKAGRYDYKFFMMSKPSLCPSLVFSQATSLIKVSRKTTSLFVVNIVIITLLFISLLFQNQAQAQDSSFLFKEALTEISEMLSDNDLNFKKAVFITEQAYDGGLNQDDFDDKLELLVRLAQKISNDVVIEYELQDSNSVKKSNAIFMLLSDTLVINFESIISYHLPFSYNSNDIYGQKDWTQMFVSRLLDDHRGNCHSLTYLYKILAEELDVKAQLVLAPNHIYIRQYSLKANWYNIELTSRSFPTDAWIMASGYISLEAIQNGIYMSGLSDQEAVALCLIDLAKGFERKFGDSDPNFIIKCCDISLQYFPTNVSALLLKAETLKKLFDTKMKLLGIDTPQLLLDDPKYKAIWNDMEKLYLQVYKLGYRQRSKQVYEAWLKSMTSK